MPGSYLAGLATEAASVTTPTLLHPLGDGTVRSRAVGRYDGGRAGRSVALVAPHSAHGLGGLLVGEPRGHGAGSSDSGGARLHLFDPLASEAGLEPRAAFSHGGETANAGGQLGEWVRSAVVGGRVYALIGGFRGHGVGIDTGSAYVVDLGEAVP